MKHTIKSTRIADLKARIARARCCIAYADRCEKDSRSLNLTAEQLAVIKTDAAAVRDPARKVLQILLSESKGVAP